jgi:hypothetical protein
MIAGEESWSQRIVQYLSLSMRVCSFVCLFAVLVASVLGKGRLHKFSEVFNDVPLPCAANCGAERVFHLPGMQLQLRAGT